MTVLPHIGVSLPLFLPAFPSLKRTNKYNLKAKAKETLSLTSRALCASQLSPHTLGTRAGKVFRYTFSAETIPSPDFILDPKRPEAFWI